VPFRCQGGAEFFFAEDFGGTHLAAATGVFVTADLVCGFGDDLGNFDAFAVGVDGNEGEVGGRDVAKFLLADVFGPSP